MQFSPITVAGTAVKTPSIRAVTSVFSSPGALCDDDDALCPGAASPGSVTSRRGIDRFEASSSSDPYFCEVKFGSDSSGLVDVGRPESLGPRISLSLWVVGCREVDRARGGGCLESASKERGGGSRGWAALSLDSRLRK